MTGTLRARPVDHHRHVTVPADPSVNGYELTAQEQAFFGRAIDQRFLDLNAARKISPNTREFFNAAELTEGTLPDSARTALAELRRGDADAALLRNLPCDVPIASVPRETNETYVPRRGHAWVAMAVRRLGHETAYALEKNGALVHDIRPTHEGARTQSNESWKVELCLHTDNAFHPIRPDFVILYCVRASDDTPATKMSFLDDVLTHLTDQEIAVLRERRFAVRVVDSFRAEGEVDCELPVSVLSGSPRRPTVRWHESLHGTDHQSARVCDAFKEAAQRVAYHIPLRPGDLLAFANHRCLHGRDRFNAGLDGRDRWLLRAYALRDWTRSESFVAPMHRPAIRLDLTMEIGV